MKMMKRVIRKRIRINVNPLPVLKKFFLKNEI